MIKELKRKVKYLTLKTKKGTFRVKFEWDSRDKVYLVTVPSLPGAITFGSTLNEAKKMAQEVIELHCECMVEEGHIIVDDNKKLVNSKGSIVKSIPSGVVPKFS